MKGFTTIKVSYGSSNRAPRNRDGTLSIPSPLADLGLATNAAHLPMNPARHRINDLRLPHGAKNHPTNLVSLPTSFFIYTLDAIRLRIAAIIHRPSHIWHRTKAVFHPIRHMFAVFPSKPPETSASGFAIAAIEHKEHNRISIQNAQSWINTYHEQMVKIGILSQ